MPKRKSYGYSGSARSAVRAVATAAKIARRLYTRTVTESKSREGPSNAITQQHDSKLLYRRKRAPRGVRRKARKRYIKNVRDALNLAGNITNLFANSNSVSATTAGQQALFCIYSGMMYGNIGENTSTIGARNEAIGSLYNLYQNIIGGTGTAVENSSKKMYLTGMTTDYTMTNLSENLAEVDIYEFVFRKDYNIKSGDSGSPLSGEFEQVTQSESKLAGASTLMQVQDLGWTPFDSESMLKYIVIQSKQRFYMGAGNTISFTKRVSFKSPIKICGEDFDGYDPTEGFPTDFKYLRGATRGILVVYRGVPGISSAESVQLGWNAQSRYKAKVIEPNENFNAFGL